MRLAQEAEDTTLNATDAQKFYDATDSASDYFLSTDSAEYRKALYILLKSGVTGRDNPPTMFRLAAYLETHPETDGAEMVPDLYRLSADRDFMPALVNFSDAVSKDHSVPPEVYEAYLRYAFDLDAEDGGWNILFYLSNFYLFDFPDRDPQGYLRKAVERYRAFGDEIEATRLEYNMYDEGRDVPRDRAMRVVAAKRALAAGSFWIMADIGLAYRDGDGVPYDRDLSRDYLVACLDYDPTVPCAINLAVLHEDDVPEGEESPLVAALYKYAVDLNPDSVSKAAAIARERFADSLPYLNPDEIAQMDIYYAAITSGDYSTIPHLKDARPVPELAEYAPAE